MGSPFPLGPVPPPFFKAASCGVSFRRARGALRCYAQNFVLSAWCHRVSISRENSYLVRSLARSHGASNATPPPSDTPENSQWRGGTNVGQRKSAREKGRKNSVAREQPPDCFCSDERVMDIKWVHGTHRQINSIFSRPCCFSRARF